MVSKRRRLSSSPGGETSGKRITRSATLREEARQHDLNKSEKQEKQTSTAQVPDAKREMGVSSQQVQPRVAEVTIVNDMLNNPIECHEYRPSDTTIAPKCNLTLLFTHGAGGTLAASAVVDFCTGFAQHSNVLVFQGSMNLKSRVKAFHACISHLHIEKDGRRRLALGGRSMGARAAVIAASESELVTATARVDGHCLSLILVSYPLKSPNGDVRDEILFNLPPTARVLFIIGDRDEMCPLSLLRETMEKMSAKSELVTIAGADHGLHVKPVGSGKGFVTEAGKMAAEWAIDDAYQVRDIGETACSQSHVYEGDQRRQVG